MGAGNALITDEDGQVIDIVPVAEAGDNIEHFNGILSPGFINAHCHLELSHMKGRIPEKTGLVDFVFKVMAERHFTEAEILTGIEAAEKEMLQNGIVAVGDICNNAFTLAQKSKQQLRYYNFIETSGFPPSAAAVRFERSAGVYQQFAALFPQSSLVPHAPYSVSQGLFALINAQASQKVLSIHNQETEAENEFFQSGGGDFSRLYNALGIDISFFKPSGKTSLQSFLPYLTNQRTLILVHNVCTTKEDVEFLQRSTINGQRSTFFCLCPNANQYITGSLPDVDLLMSQQCDIVLGTDSLASNHQLNILEEMKTLQQHFPHITTATLLQWATINGARALQMDNELGSFEKGKRPGIVLIENTAHNNLCGDSVAQRIL